MAVRHSRAREVAQVAVFAALIAALGLPGTLYLAGNAVPLTLQTLGVMLAAAILGARNGFLAVLTFEVLMLAGLPLLAGGRGGPAPFVGPSAGYLYGFLLGALVIGALAERTRPRSASRIGSFWWWIAILVVGGVLVIYCCGSAWLLLRGAAFGPAVGANALYLPGDLLKVVVAASVAGQVHRAYPGLLDGRASRPSSTDPGSRSEQGTRSGSRPPS